ncbi:MFS transporter [Gabonibacter chumensis]|uniref:MFS transporter n=1 Tax=Gabonibacter chumensis TaxID=2972474 RepID=UPI002572220B|nr:MFS transporter [Gabonibacter chumensis]MCR9011691.1 MFS transporter [Gabonibacter chumensis]
MNKQTHPTQQSSWSWIPTLYFAQGLPYVIVMTLAVIMYKRLGINNTDIALYTSWFYLPWVIKPLWSPLVDIMKTKRWWVVSMQLMIGGSLACIALTLPGPNAFRYSLAFMWLLAFSSATHDIAADGFYMLGLNTRQQAFFVGIRNTFYRLAMLTGQGLIVMLAGWLEKTYSIQLPEEIAVSKAWSITFYLLTGIFLILFLYHQFVLPKPQEDTAVKNDDYLKAFFDTFLSFFRKPGIVTALLFMLLFRLAESQLVKIASPFLLDKPEVGGLGMSTLQVGTLYGVVGLIALITGGISGGVVIARNGLKHWIMWMTAAMNLPNLVYLYLAYARPDNVYLISSCVAIEQLGYGFGFTALTFFMILFSKGKEQTAHYAICTGFMALGMMLPGMLSGWIQKEVGYQHFFIWIMLCTIPSFLAARKIHKNL